MPSHQDEEVPFQRQQRSWTRAEDYLDIDRFIRRAVRQRKAARRHATPTEPRDPRALLGIIPFLLLMTALAVLAVMVMIAGFPGQQRYPDPPVKQEQQPAVRMDLPPQR